MFQRSFKGDTIAMSVGLRSKEEEEEMWCMKQQQQKAVSAR